MTSKKGAIPFEDESTNVCLAWGQ